MTDRDVAELVDRVHSCLGAFTDLTAISYNIKKSDLFCLY